MEILTAALNSSRYLVYLQIFIFVTGRYVALILQLLSLTFHVICTI